MRFLEMITILNTLYCPDSSDFSDGLLDLLRSFTQVGLPNPASFLMDFLTLSQLCCILIHFFTLSLSLDQCYKTRVWTDFR